jgi:hypothetical protein
LKSTHGLKLIVPVKPSPVMTGSAGMAAASWRCDG